MYVFLYFTADCPQKSESSGHPSFDISVAVYSFRYCNVIGDTVFIDILYGFIKASLIASKQELTAFPFLSCLEFTSHWSLSLGVTSWLRVTGSCLPWCRSSGITTSIVWNQGQTIASHCRLGHLLFLRGWGVRWNDLDVLVLSPLFGKAVTPGCLFLWRWMWQCLSVCSLNKSQRSTLIQPQSFAYQSHWNCHSHPVFVVESQRHASTQITTYVLYRNMHLDDFLFSHDL